MKEVTKEQIYKGAIFGDSEGNEMTIKRISPTVYADGTEFDAETKNEEAMATKLTKWGFKHIGCE